MLRAVTTDAEQHQAEYERFRARALEAETHLAAGRFSDAIQVYEDMTRRFEPNFYFGELYVGLGCAFVGLDQPEHAVRQFRVALEHAPRLVPAHLNLGLTQTRLGDLQGALDTFGRAFQICIDSSEKRTAVQMGVYCGQLCEELERDEAALEWYERLLSSVSQDYSQVWYLAACVHAQRDHVDTATAYLRTAIACTPAWPSAFYKLSKMTEDPAEKRQLFARFVEAQQALAKDAEHAASMVTVTGSKSGLI